MGFLLRYKAEEKLGTMLFPGSCRLPCPGVRFLVLLTAV